MELKHRLTPSAKADLEELIAFIARDSISAAENVKIRLLHACRTLTQSPEMGRSRPELAEGVRSWPVGGYVIFYRNSEGFIEVLRFLHGARDIDAQFGQRDS